jgi:exopolysaccharide biosynthesis WecB/TagA/CpsF family protein
MQTVTLLNISIHNISLRKLLESLTNQGGFVVTPNVDHFVKLQKDQDLVNVYQQADYRVCDSKIVEKTLAFLGTPIKEKISGSDLFPAFYEYNKDNENVTIFLLGGETGIPEQAQNNINAKVGRNIIVDALSPSFGFEKDERECLTIVERINQSGANVLAVCVGTPKQEKWIAKYRHLLPNVKTFLAIGATIDFEAGNKPRAPKWMSNNGLEWFYRLASEPKRLWKRYLIESLPFFGYVLQQKIQMSFASKSNYSGSQSNLTINQKKL